MAEKPELLLIDDEPLILDSLKILFKRDYQVYTAQSGEQGLKEIKQHPNIKVVICDQRMPGLLGHETLREIKRLSPHTIRILLTGYSDLDAILNSVNSGEVFRYISKPWNSDNLMRVVELGFRISERLEKVERDAAAKKADTLNGATMHKNAVLFVDEQAAVVQTLVNQFSTKYDAAGVSSTDEALRELSKRPVSVVVSNVDFADADAIDFLNAISHEYPNTITLIYTEQRDATLAIRAINELNVFRYLVKPSDDAKLADTLAAAIERSNARDQKLEASTIHIGREVAPDKSDVSTLRRKIESSTYLLKLRAMRTTQR
ncbi:MAG: hypothetical protein HY22_12420 [[Candidatus Thermochlorobacteriaceae] bacterium GBChlB]|nr:MAG: hypothetical protein HY22_12420 [[Candidatus Thermochlorobacteriaceae] bacterium GBChlB]